MIQFDDITTDVRKLLRDHNVEEAPVPAEEIAAALRRTCPGTARLMRNFRA